MEEETKSKIKRVLRNAGLVVMALFAVFGAFSAVLACRSCSVTNETSESARLAPITLAERKGMAEASEGSLNLLDPEAGAIEVDDRRINGVQTGTSYAAIHKNTNYNLWYTAPLKAGIYCYSRNTNVWSGYRCLAPLNRLLGVLASVEASSSPWTPVPVADSFDVVNDEAKNTFYFQISDYLASENYVFVTSVAKPYENIDTLYLMDGLTYPNIAYFKFADIPQFYSLIGGTPLGYSSVFNATNYTEYFQVRSFLFRWRGRVYDGFQVQFGIFGEYPYVNYNYKVVTGSNDVFYPKLIRFHDASRNEWFNVGGMTPQATGVLNASSGEYYGNLINVFRWYYEAPEIEVLKWSIPSWNADTNTSLSAEVQVGMLGRSWNASVTSPLISPDGQNPFELLAAGFAAAVSFFGIQILPGITIGLLLLTPLIVTIVLVLVKLLQK